MNDPPSSAKGCVSQSVVHISIHNRTEAGPADSILSCEQSESFNPVAAGQAAVLMDVLGLHLTQDDSDISFPKSAFLFESIHPHHIALNAELT